MTKAKNYWVLAIGMALLALMEAVSGFVLWLGFPTGGGGGRGWGGGLVSQTFWGLSRHTWIDIHYWVAVAPVVLVIIHVLLHWKWIVRVGKSIFKGKPKKLVPIPVRNN